MILKAIWKKNDRKARWLIFGASALVFFVVMLLGQVRLNPGFAFDVHIFARINAVLNSAVSIFLLAALVSVKLKNYKLHRNLMMSALVMSVLFLLSYTCHHLLAAETRFGDSNGDGFVTAEEKSGLTGSRIFYYILLGTHIPLAALILPLILFSAYRALTGDFLRHKKLGRITWPVWFYVAVSGVLLYVMIHPYYR